MPDRKFPGRDGGKKRQCPFRSGVRSSHYLVSAYTLDRQGVHSFHKLVYVMSYTLHTNIHGPYSFYSWILFLLHSSNPNMRRRQHKQQRLRLMTYFIRLLLTLCLSLSLDFPTAVISFWRERELLFGEFKFLASKPTIHFDLTNSPQATLSLYQSERFTHSYRLRHAYMYRRIPFSTRIFNVSY